MRFELTSGTDAALHVLFDPAAVTPMRDGEAMLDGDAVERLEGAGAILTVDEGGDGEARLTLVVDEAYDDDGPAGRHDAFKRPLLRVPSGRLYFTGVEYVFWDGHPQPMLKSLEPHARVPPGDYAAEGFRVSAASRAGGAGGLFNNVVAPLGIFVVLACLIGTVVALLVRGRPWAWKLRWAGWSAGCGVLVAFILTALGRTRWGAGAGGANGNRRVIVLRRLGGRAR